MALIFVYTYFTLLLTYALYFKIKVQGLLYRDLGLCPHKKMSYIFQTYDYFMVLGGEKGQWIIYDIKNNKKAFLLWVNYILLQTISLLVWMPKYGLMICVETYSEWSEILQ